MKFTSHNILLPDGARTLGEGCRLLTDGPLWTAIKQALEQAMPDAAERETMNAVDLGCMEGGYTAALADLGFTTLGIDARQASLLKANYVKLRLNRPKMSFALGNANDLAAYGPFDLTLCLGLLYHLQNPAAFLKMAYGQTRRMMLIHTFAAPGKDLFYDLETLVYRFFRRGFTRKKGTSPATPGAPAGFTPFIRHRKNYRLSGLTSHEGYRGRWFREWDEHTDAQTVENMASAAYGNPRSFWFCKEEIIRALYDAGFSRVCQVTYAEEGAAAGGSGGYYQPVLLVATV